MEEQSNEALWYVVHTYSGYENKVATDLQTMVENRRLQDLICDIKVPTEMVPEIKDGKERMVEHKLFPGYVLSRWSCTTIPGMSCAIRAAAPVSSALPRSLSP